MTIAVDAPTWPSVFSAGLPTVDYEHYESPDEAHNIIKAARWQAPIAIGPHGPELLTYELVRTMLRDPRFRVPQGMFLASPGHLAAPHCGVAIHQLGDHLDDRRAQPRGGSRCEGLDTSRRSRWCSGPSRLIRFVATRSNKGPLVSSIDSRRKPTIVVRYGAAAGSCSPPAAARPDLR